MWELPEGATVKDEVTTYKKHQAQVAKEARETLEDLYPEYFTETKKPKIEIDH